MRTAFLPLALLVAVPAAAQLLPALPRVADPVRPLLNDATALPARATERLETLRRARIADLVRAHPDAVALDPQGFPARAGEVVVADPGDALVAAAAAAGFRLIERDAALGVGFARFATPRGVSLGAAIRTLRRLGASGVEADRLHESSGAVPAAGGGIAAAPAGGGPTIGMIDGGVAGLGVGQRGFAVGAPKPSDHGSAVASLIVGQGAVRGATPGARLLVADVYGTDTAGGSATAIGKALAWLVGEGAPVVTVSLVGPPSVFLARIVAAAQARGTIVVAAVGNDGPGAPPAYPASYPGVVAVTGVDRRDRVLIEAGRSLHLDYAAPGADMLAADARGRAVAVRGTSYAAPLVAARLALRYPRPVPGAPAAAIAALDREARPLGRRYGRGLVCGDCRTLAR